MNIQHLKSESIKEQAQMPQYQNFIPHTSLKVGMLIFPQITLLDFAGPYEVFSRAQCFEVFLFGETTEPVKAEGGMIVKADFDLNQCPQFDVIFIPGGRGVSALIENKTLLNFLKTQGKAAKYITSVCTGSLVLAATGLLDGYKATTHWRSLELLRMFGVETMEERVVIDGNRITGGGITAGIDFGLVLTAIIGGEEMAKKIQLQLEYEPAPPFQCGSPKNAEKNILDKAMEATQPLFNLRKEMIEGILEKRNVF